jgi:hypothetical protein
MTREDKLFQAALAILTNRIGAHVVIDIAIQDSVKEAKRFVELVEEASKPIDVRSLELVGVSDEDIISALGSSDSSEPSSQS